MKVIFRGGKTAVTSDGYPICGRTQYVYELTTPDDAIYCEAKFQIPVRTQSFSAQLYARRNFLYLDVPGSADSLASDLLQWIERLPVVV